MIIKKTNLSNQLIIIFIILLSPQDIFCMQTLKNIFGGFEGAIKSGDTKKLQEHLNSKLHISEENLLLAVNYNQPEAMKLLLKYKQDKSIVFKSLEASIKNKNLEMAKLIMENSSYTYNENELEFIMNYLLSHDNKELFKTFIKTQKNKIEDEFYYAHLPNRYLNINTNHNLLGWAIMFKSKKIIKYILKNYLNENTYKIKHREYFSIENGESVKKVDTITYNYLGLACIVSNQEIIDLFFKYTSANISQAYLWIKENITTLIKKPIDQSIMKLLKNKSVDQNSKIIDNITQNNSELPTTINPKTIYNNGNNVLHLALEHHNYKLCKNILKKNPILMHEFNHNSETPHEILTNEFIKLIKEDYKKSLFTNMLKELILNIRFSNLKDANRDNLLHHAVKEQNLELINIILHFNPELILARNKQGHTPIHLAVNNKKILNFLIEAAYKT